MNPKAQQIIDLAGQLSAETDRRAFVFQPAVMLAPHIEWGVGRSKPVSNPPIHGTAIWTAGDPATLAFNPVKIPNDSDNLYVHWKLAPYIPMPVSAITKVKYGFDLTIDKPAFCQAFEWECQKQVANTIWNMAFQLLPGLPAWTIRVFDYNVGSWISTGATIPPIAMLGPVNVMGEFTLKSNSVTHESVTVGALTYTLGISHSTAQSMTPSNYFNCAIQPDSNNVASPYRVTIGKMQVIVS